MVTWNDRHRFDRRSYCKSDNAGKDPGGFFITVLLGIVGSVTAGWIGRAIGWYETGEPAGWIASIVGAVIVLAIYRAFAHRDAGGTGYRRAA